MGCAVSANPTSRRSSTTPTTRLRLPPRITPHQDLADRVLAPPRPACEAFADHDLTEALPSVAIDEGATGLQLHAHRLEKGNWLARGWLVAAYMGLIVLVLTRRS